MNVSCLLIGKKIRIVNQFEQNRVLRENIDIKKIFSRQLTGRDDFQLKILNWQFSWSFLHLFCFSMIKNQKGEKQNETHNHGWALHISRQLRCLLGWYLKSDGSYGVWRMPLWLFVARGSLAQRDRWCFWTSTNRISSVWNQLWICHRMILILILIKTKAV